RERVAALRAQDRPVAAGRFLTKSEAEAAIVCADWVLIPSRIESIPVVFSDAVKLGRPVVAMPVGDLERLLLQTGAGIIAEKTTAREYCSAITKALGSVASEMSVSETFVQQFDPARIASRLLADNIPHADGYRE